MAVRPPSALHIFVLSLVLLFPTAIRAQSRASLPDPSLHPSPISDSESVILPVSTAGASVNDILRQLDEEEAALKLKRSFAKTLQGATLEAKLQLDVARNEQEQLADVVAEAEDAAKAAKTLADQLKEKLAALERLEDVTDFAADVAELKSTLKERELASEKADLTAREVGRLAEASMPKVERAEAKLAQLEAELARVMEEVAEEEARMKRLRLYALEAAARARATARKVVS